MKNVYTVLLALVLVGFGFLASSVNAQDDRRPILNPTHAVLYTSPRLVPAALSTGLNTVQYASIFSGNGPVRVTSMNFRAYQVGDFVIEGCTIIMNGTNVPSSVSITADRYAETSMTVDFTDGYLLQSGIENSVEMICNLSSVPTSSMLLSVVESATYTTTGKNGVMDTTQYPVIDQAHSTAGPLAMATVGNGLRIYEVISEMYSNATADWAVIIVPSGDYQDDYLPIGPNTKYFFLGVGDAKVTNEIRTLNVSGNGQVAVHNLELVSTEPGIGAYYDGTVFGDWGSRFEIVNCRIRSASIIGISGSYNYYTTVADSEVTSVGRRHRDSVSIRLGQQSELGPRMGARVYRNRISRFGTGIDFGYSYYPGEISPGSTTVDSNSYHSVGTPFVPSM